MMLLALSALLSAVVADPTQCSVVPGGPLDGPCQQGREFCGPLFSSTYTAPSYHIMDESCAENDPNFPLYDPLHSLYHHFWQAHLATPPGFGPDIGHAFSSDLVYWHHLPVAVWNDKDYDNMAIYTGSATIVDGVPTLVYPGLCKKQYWPACNTGTLLAIALPADHANDPTLANWTKPAYNPIVENTQRDPSTAWQTASGEWRMTNYEGVIFSSKDFVQWQRAPDGKNLFNASAPAPTHVHKESNGGDWYTMGVYTEGPDGTSGSWAPTATMRRTPLDASQLLGIPMTFYASKSFWDPVQARRIYWGWALVGPASTQTLPRVTTYHAALQRLVWAPLPQLSALRGATLYAAPALAIPSGGTARISAAVPAGGANRSELLLSFALPPTAATFGLSLWPAGYGSGTPTQLRIAFDAASFTANLTLSSGAVPSNASYYMPGVDMPGNDLSVTSENYTDPHLCQAACNATPACKGFTYVVRPPLKGDCCLKSAVGALDSNPTCTSGVRPGAGPGPQPQGPFAPIPLLPGDKAVDIHLFMDSTIVEAFIMEGRQALTLRMDGTEDFQIGVEAFSGDASVQDVSLFAMNSIWVSKEQVLASRP